MSEKKILKTIAKLSRLTGMAMAFGLSASVVSVHAANYAGMKRIASKDKSFTMGFTSGDNTWSCVVGAHKVSFTYDLYVDSTKVTQADFKSLMGFDPSSNKTGLAGLPVDQETFFDAALYCNARSKRDKLDTVYTYTSKTKNGNLVTDMGGFAYDIRKSGYRIPTNSEYEYIWGAGTAATYFWGEDKSDAMVSQYGWFGNGTGSATGGNSGGHTHPVALKRPNPFGLYDISGNLFEWTGDFDSPYPTTDQVDPVGPALGVLNVCGGGSDVQTKVVRGGSWYCDAAGHQRIRYHYKWKPSTSNHEIGFRAVAMAPAASTPLKSNSPQAPAPGLERAMRTASNGVRLYFRTASAAPVVIVFSNAQGTEVRRAFLERAAIGRNEIDLPGKIHGVLFVGLEQDGKWVRASLPVLNQP